MSIKAVLFDLDGTLLPMDQDLFVKTYLKHLAIKLAPFGYETEKFMKAMWLGVGAMIENDGAVLNEKRFWEVFCGFFGEKALSDLPYFDEFYRNEFMKAKDACGFNEKAAVTVRKIKEKGLRVILATNPLFPAIATENRIRWAGLTPEDFELYTTYEICHFCKPNLDYYTEILEKTGLKAEECLMVGNDVAEDMITEKLGMKTFLMTECLLNKNNEDISKYRQGSFDELMEYIESI